MNENRTAIQSGKSTYYSCVLRMVADESSETCRVEIRPINGGRQHVFGDLGQAFEFLQQRVLISAETSPSEHISTQ